MLIRIYSESAEYVFKGHALPSTVAWQSTLLCVTLYHHSTLIRAHTSHMSKGSSLNIYMEKSSSTDPKVAVLSHSFQTNSSSTLIAMSLKRNPKQNKVALTKSV